MRGCGIFGRRLFWCDSGRRKHSRSAVTPRGGNISCVAGLRNMLPGLGGQISDGAALRCRRLCVTRPSGTRRAALLFTGIICSFPGSEREHFSWDEGWD